MGIIAVYSMRCDDCGDGEDSFYDASSARLVKSARQAGWCNTTINEDGKQRKVWRCPDCRASRRYKLKGFILKIRFAHGAEVKQKVKTIEEVSEMVMFIKKNYPPDRKIQVTDMYQRDVDPHTGELLEENLYG